LHGGGYQEGKTHTSKGELKSGEKRGKRTSGGALCGVLGAATARRKWPARVIKRGGGHGEEKNNSLVPPRNKKGKTKGKNFEQRTSPNQNEANNIKKGSITSLNQVKEGEKREKV